MAKKEQKNTESIIDNFFRHQSSKVLSSLTNYFGSQHFEIIEDSIQDVLLKASQTWPFSGIPNNPDGWIYQATRNKVLDKLRRESNFQSKQVLLETDSNYELSPSEDFDFEDDQVRMMFACCSDSISTENQIILILRILCGFSNEEVAKAMLKKPEAIAKAYTRAKGKFKEAGLKSIPEGEELLQQLDVILKAIYLIFNEGYVASKGEILTRQELCEEAIRLTHILINNKYCQQPKALGLLSLMYLHAARLKSRIGPSGQLITLKDQNRDDWNKTWIAVGLDYLNESATGNKLSEYHIQASIAAVHCISPSYESTDWKTILVQYDQLYQLTGSLVVALNRIVAVWKAKGNKKALQELGALDTSKAKDYYLFYTIKAELLADMGNNKEAIENLEIALSLTMNKPERAHIDNKINELR